MGGLLGGKLTASAGLGGTPSAGAYSNPSYGSNSTMVAASSTGPIPGFGTVQQGAGDLGQGRVTLAGLELLVLGIVVFYIWTHKIQGGG